MVEHDYGQHALIADVQVAGGHRHTAFERFTPQGPVALLPKGEGYALVHVARPETADELLALDDAAYLARLQAHIGGRARLTGVGPRLRYPLVLRYRRSTIAQRTVWLGNAAQTLHPVAGQGFNLALRDVWALADALLQRARGGSTAFRPTRLRPRAHSTPAPLRILAALCERPRPRPPRHDPLHRHPGAGVQQRLRARCAMRAAPRCSRST